MRAIRDSLDHLKTACRLRVAFDLSKRKMARHRSNLIGRFTLFRPIDAEGFPRAMQARTHASITRCPPKQVAYTTRRPDMVPALRPQPDTGSVVQPKPARLRLPYRHLQPLSPPWAPDTFVVRLPSGIPHHGRNRAIPRTAIWPGQFDDVGDQAIFARPRGSLRCAGRCWRSTRQARRPETPGSLSDMISRPGGARGPEASPRGRPQDPASGQAPHA